MPGSDSYRGLPPVRLDGSTARRSGFGSGPEFRGSRRHPVRRLLGQIFGSGSPLRHLNWILLAAVLALCTLGTLLVWSATATTGLNASDPYLTKQVLNLAIGLALMVGVSMLDYRQLRQYAPVVLAASCLALVVVLLPLGSVTAPVNGSKSWISLGGGFQIEPSEYAKLSIIFVCAMILGDVRRREVRPRMRAVAIMLAVSVVPLVLVVAEPDLGVAIVMLALIVGMIALSGIRLRWLGALVAGGAVGVFAVVNLHLLKAYQMSRLTAFLHPSADPQGSGYSAYQSKVAIGSGGLTGQGLFHGQLVAGGFVPEQHTDFIFAVAGEELGFVGCLVIIGLLAVVLLCAIRIAARADDQFGTLVAGGIAIWFAVQSFINIGMTIGIMPVTGLPLPFVSYGGSAIFADMIAIGALQAVHRHRSVFA
ncbi:MAG TPA: rod shape-determining protein RodA [Streptosporangiaceae bacterium]|nr:rod shape-determining protein RodA [Streptosporangiaceae bacterium]